MTADPITITSLDDPRVELYRNVRDRDLYGRDDVFIAESELVVERLLRSPERLHSVLLTPARYKAIHSGCIALPESVPVFIAELELMCDIAGFHIHRGALALGHRPNKHDLSLDVVLGQLRHIDTLRLLLAEGITNVDNIGGLFRIAAAFGIDAVVLDHACCDPLYRKAIRVSMGHVLSVPYAISANWHQDLQRLQQQWGITIIGAETGSQSQPIWDIPGYARSALVVGSEAHGLQTATLDICDHVAEIPMHNNVSSLNVVTAAAIFAYQAQHSLQ